MTASDAQIEIAILASIERQANRTAAALQRVVETLAEETLALSKVGLQQAEPRSILGFLVATAPKVYAMAGRATKILNAKGSVSGIHVEQEGAR